MNRIPFRQIHLDFHTSPYIDGIGEQFHPEEFIDTLQKAHVNSINLFAKCHHGMYYYPTELGVMHPNLTFDLFGAQIKACKENGIRALAYTCVAWNEDCANRHPDWLIYDFNGLRGGKKPFDCSYYSWNHLCINNPDYKALLKLELKEIYTKYHPDGFWIDLVSAKDCVCKHCIKDMEALGLNPEKIEDVKKFNKISETKFCKEFYAYLKAMDDSLCIYFNACPYELDNASSYELSSVKKREFFDVIDVESLPSGQWGYTHFPVAVNYINKYAKEICMMNGKFHTSWGDFGSLRNKAALEYECYRALANGSRICIGDQLHPNGKLDDPVYERIGQIYQVVEKVETYMDEVEKIREVAVLIPDQPASGDPLVGSLIDQGVYRILSELHIPFDFVNLLDPLCGYQLLILPDEAEVDEAYAKKISEFVKYGGKLLVTGKSAVKDSKFMLPEICAEYVKPSEYDTRYIAFNHPIFDSLPQMNHVLYDPGEVVKPKEEVLANIVNPYFSRTYQHFCSHRQTPPDPDSKGECAIVADGNCIYICSPLFKSYAEYGYTVYRDIIGECIEYLLKDLLITTDLPPISELTLWNTKQGIMLHLLNYVIQRKARQLDTIEEMFTVSNKQVNIVVDYEPRKVINVLTGKEFRYFMQGPMATIMLDEAKGYTPILIMK